jgi:acyl-CoA thioesterase FadM
MSSTMQAEPIKYEGHVDIRFADLDPYGHVNSKHYVDLVSTVRLNFMSQELKTPLESMTDKGIGFYLTKLTINYRRPIIGLQKVFVSSYVSEIRDEKVLIVPFEIKTADGTKLYSDGVLEFSVVDLKTNRMTILPTWVAKLLFAM